MKTTETGVLVYVGELPTGVCNLFCNWLQAGVQGLQNKCTCPKPCTPMYTSSLEGMKGRFSTGRSGLGWLKMGKIKAILVNICISMYLIKSKTRVFVFVLYGKASAGVLQVYVKNPMFINVHLGNGITDGRSGS